MTQPEPDAPALPGKSVFSRAIFALAIVLASVAVGGGVVVLAVGTGEDDSASGTVSTAKSATPTTSLPANSTPSPVLAPAVENGPLPTGAGLASAMSGPLSAPALGKVTAVVIDPVSGKTLLDSGGLSSMQPGSTLKLYTAIAAASLIEPGHRLTTKVVAGAAAGEIVLVGGGDPTLSTASTSTLYPGAATIDQLAAAAKKGGATGVSRIVVDTSYYSGPQTASGWASGDAPSTYAAPITAVMVDGGRTSTADKAMRSSSPAIAAGQALARALGVPNAEVVGGSAPQAAKELGSVNSAPIEDLIEQAISTSDNTLTECLAREVAIAMKQPASFAGAVTAIKAAVKKLKIDVTGLVMKDGSGLSSEDRTTAASLGSLLTVAASGTQARTDVVLSALSVGGYNGTLAARFRGEDAPTGAGQVRAKTGTLSAVDSLAGTVLTKDDRLLVFAFISNGGAGVEPTRAALDTAAATLASCGCR